MKLLTIPRIKVVEVEEKRKRNENKKKKTIRKNDDKCILYYFTMNGCPYCNDFNPHWEKVVKSFSKITMEKIERNERSQKGSFI